MANENEKINPDQITDTEETLQLDGLKAALSKEPVPEELTPEAVQGMLGGGAKKKPGAGSWRKWSLMAAGLLLCVVLAGVYAVKNTGGKKTDTDSLVADASGYTALYDILTSQHQTQAAYEETTDAVYDADDGVTEIAEDTGSAEVSTGSTAETTYAGSTASGAASVDYSDTNVQTEGVDEADTVKTDGTFLFLRGEDYLGDYDPRLCVVRADGGSLTLTDELTFAPEDDDETVSLCEFYVADGILTLFVQYGQAEYYTDGENGYETCESDDAACTTVNTRDTVTAYTYRVEDDGTLTEIGSRTQDGVYNTSRKVGHTVYLFTSYYPFLEHLEEEMPEEFVPHVNGTLLSEESISIRDTSYYEYEGGIEAQYSWYIVVSAFSDEAPQETLDEMAVFTHDYGDSLYAGTQALYFLQHRYVTEKDMDGMEQEQTCLLKYSYADGEFTAQGEAALSGGVNDTFSLYENGDYLYVVTTQSDESTGWEEINHLYVLDGMLQVTGTIDNIAEGETIQSARFVGTTGYFVTYEQTDPLFTADLSDPYAPVITGELTLPGFSSYLHFYSDTLLLGLGEETLEDGTFVSYKMAMYDISDPANVQEQAKLLLDDVPGIGDVVYWMVDGTSYKKLLIDTEKNLIGFLTNCDERKWTGTARYLLFSYENGTFVNKLAFDVTEATGWFPGTVRGLYIGDTFYLCMCHEKGQTVCAFDMTNDYVQTGTLQLLSE